MFEVAVVGRVDMSVSVCALLSGYPGIQTRNGHTYA